MRYTPGVVGKSLTFSCGGRLSAGAASGVGLASLDIGHSGWAVSGSPKRQQGLGLMPLLAPRAEDPYRGAASSGRSSDFSAGLRSNTFVPTWHAPLGPQVPPRNFENTSTHNTAKPATA